MNAATDQISDRGILSLYTFESHLLYLFHVFEHVCHLLWALKKRAGKPNSRPNIDSVFPKGSFYVIIPLQKRMRELKTALLLISYMAFGTLGSNS